MSIANSNETPKSVFGETNFRLSIDGAVDAIRNMGLSAETLAYALGFASVSATYDGTWDAEVARLAEELGKPTAPISAELHPLFVQLGAHLQNIDAYRRGDSRDHNQLIRMIERICNVNAVSPEQLIMLTGVSADTFWAYMSSPSSISADDQFHLAISITRLYTILNYPPQRSVVLDLLVQQRALDYGLTPEEMKQGYEALNRPILRNLDTVG